MTKEKMFESFDYILEQLKDGYIDLGFHDNDELEAVEQAINRQIPKKPIHIHEQHSEHLWQRNKNGEIDLWAFESGYCNGPVCTRCWHSECVHCNEDWETDPVCDCVVDKDICPVCGSVLTWKHKYCHECGQALDWSESV